MSLLEKWSKEVVERAQRNIGATRNVNGKSRRIDFSGRLRKSLGFTISEKSGKTTIKFTSSTDYAAFINEGVEGVKGSKFKSRFSFKGNENPSKNHVSAIERWMEKKPIRIRKTFVNKNGQKVSQFVAAKDYQKRGVAFVIARSIRRKGISPTHFMDEAILEGIDTLDDTLAKMIDIELDNRFN